MNFILSVSENLIAAGISQFIANKWRDRERDQQLQSDFDAWYEREKGQPYFSALDRALSNSNIIREFIAYLRIPDRHFSMSDRIDELFCHDSFTEEEKISISQAVETLLKTIENNLLRGDSKDTNRLAVIIENSKSEAISVFSEKIDAIINSIHRENTNTIFISQLHGEYVSESNSIISRKMFPNNESYSSQGEIPFFVPMNIIEDKKKILVIGEAGYGKSYFLYQIYFEAKERGFHALHYSLKHNSFPDVLHLLETKQLNVDCKTVLILDGLDEVNDEIRDHIIKSIQAIDSEKMDLFVVLSMRTNFYTGAIEGIEVYEIEPLDEENKKQYIQENRIDYDCFINCVYEMQLYDVYQNAFFFTEMVRLWQENEKLPNSSELMEKITDSRIDADTKKFEQTISLPKHLIKKDLQNIALVMHCIQEFSLSSSQIEKIIGHDDLLQLSKYQGLLECINEQWSFRHNNFKEFYAAMALSKFDLELIKGIISENIDHEEHIRPSWNNVISFFLMRDKNRDLLNWVCNIQPEMIVKLERDRFTALERTEIYIHIMEQFKDNNQWFLWDYPSRKKLATFCGNEDTVNYVINELEGNITVRQKQNLLRSMVHFESFFSKEQDIKGIILFIIFNAELPEFLRIDAMNVVEEHLELFADNSDSIIKLFNADLNENMTYAILKIIDAYGKAEEQLDIILESYNKHDRMNNSLISLSILYFKILQEIRTKESATKVLCFITSQPERMEDDDWKKVFDSCCNMGIHNFSGDNDCFLQLFMTIFQNNTFYYFHGCCEIIKKYFIETHTESTILASIIAGNETLDIAYKLRYILCESMLEQIINEYKQGRIENEIIKDLIYRTKEDNEANKKLRIAFFTKTHESIPEINTFEQSREAEKLGHQLYFDALFEKDKYADLINRLGEIYGNDSLITDAHIYDHYQRLNESPELRDALYGLHYIINKENEETTFANVLNYNKDWNIFLVLAVENVLHNHLQDIRISIEQHKQIEHAVFNILTPKVLNITCKEATRYTFSSLLPPCLQIIHILNLDCPEEIIKSMLIIPFQILDRDEHRTIPKYITEHLTYDKLVRNVIQNIKENKWNSFVAPNYISFCIDNRITDVKQDIIEYLFDNELNYFGINDGLEYLVKLFGYEEIEKSVLPRCTTEELLRSIAHHIPLEANCELLESKMIEMYQISRDEKWLPLLIRRSNIEAMEEYYRIASSLNRLPDLTEGSEVPFIADAFREVRRKEALPILVKLIQLTFSPGFMDKEFFGLYSGCWEAISNIAKNYYDETFTCLEYARTHDLSPFDIAISDLLNSIKAGRIITIDTPMSFETALSFI